MDITEQYLNGSIDIYSREQMKLLGEIKNSNKEEKEEKLIQQQLTQLNTIVTALMRLRNIKKKQSANF